VIAYNGGVVVDTLSQTNASAGRGATESGRVLTTGDCRELQKMKNSGNELNEVPENK